VSDPQVIEAMPPITRVPEWDLAVVGRVHEPGVELVLVERPAITWDTAALAAASVGTYRETVGPQSVGSAIRTGLDQLGLPTADLHADMADIAERFFGQFRLDSARLRIDVADQQGCPKFHCDNMHVRLITTYAGPATEYRLADRGAAVQQFPAGGIGLLKGCKHPTHRQERLLHRSPPVASGQRRVCLVLDW